MAIRYLSNIDLTNGELQNFKVQNLAADPSGPSGEGQMIYRTDINVMKYYDGSSWQTFGTSGGSVTSVAQTHGGNAFSVAGSPITGAGTLAITVVGSSSQYIDGAGNLTTFPAIPQGDITAIVAGSGMTGTSLSGPIPTLNVIGGAGITANAGDIQVDYTGAGNVILAAADGTGITVSSADRIILSDATDSNAKFVSISQITAAVGGGTMSSWTIAGDTGTPQVVVDGDQVRIVGSTGIDTVASGTDILTVNLDLSELSTVTTIDPATDFLVGVDGTANEKILYSNVHLDQWGDAEADVDFGGNKILDIATGTAGTDGVNLGQVQSLVAGVGVFQGGYNATTNTPALTGGSNVALTTGDFYAVTVGGSFFTETLEVGDLIFANNDITASSTPSLSDYTVVQSGQSIASAGASTGVTTKGVAGFDSGNFQVDGTGWTQLKDTGVTAASYGSASKSLSATVTAKGLLTSLTEQNIAITASQVTDFCTAVDTCVSGNTYVTSIGDGTAVSYNVAHNLATRDLIVQLYDNSSYDTVRAEVVRTNTNNITVTFNSAPTTNDIRVLVTKV
jgi:hypothetical protein